jgi:acyl carrier protein
MNILNVIFDAIDEVNLGLDDVKMEKNEDTVIFGTESVLDSMDLVHFISLIEEKIEDESGNYVSIADENAMSLEVSPFKTVKTLNEYIKTLL